MKKLLFIFAILILALFVVGCEPEDNVIIIVNDGGEPPFWYQQLGERYCYPANLKTIGDWWGMPIHSTQEEILYEADLNSNGWISNDEAIYYMNDHNPPLTFGYMAVATKEEYNRRLQSDTKKGYPNFTPVRPVTDDKAHIVTQMGVQEKDGELVGIVVSDPLAAGDYLSYYHIIAIEAWNKDVIVGYLDGYVRVGIVQPGLASQVLKLEEIDNLTPVNTEVGAGKDWDNTEIAKMPYSKDCPPCLEPMITSIPTISVNAADIVEAANNAIANSGVSRLIESGQPFEWAASRFDGAYAGSPIPVYKNSKKYCPPCPYENGEIAYYFVPYYAADKKNIGSVRVGSTLKAEIITIGIPNNATASNSEFLTQEKIQKRFPEANEIAAIWEDNEITGIPSTFFWKVNLPNSEERIFTVFGEEMVENPITGKLYRKGVDLNKPSNDLLLIPNAYKLSQNFPNPFNANTIISYSLPNEAFVQLVIYNIKGQKVKTLVNENQIAGAHNVIWDGSNSRGQKVASGIYFYKFQAGEHLESRKLHLLK